MIERRIGKTPEQIRDEATKLAREDIDALILAGAVSRFAGKAQEDAFLNLYKWRYERIEEESATFWSYGVPISRQQAELWPMVNIRETVPFTPPHVCKPGPFTTAGQTCVECGKLIVVEPLVEIIL